MYTASWSNDLALLDRFICINEDTCKKGKMAEKRYSKDPKTGHSNTGNIRIPDVLTIRNSNGSNHSKTGHFHPVFEW